MWRLVGLGLPLLVALAVVVGREVRWPEEEHRRTLPTPTIAAPRGGPLIGANYTHYEIEHCSLQDTGILASYGANHVRRKVRDQLAEMQRGGLQALRILIWHQSTPGNQRWGVIPSKGGLKDDHRRALALFASDVRRAGFKHFFISIAPMGANNPRNSAYDPDLFTENWRFLLDVRRVVKRAGPSRLRVDLINEAPPGFWESESVARRIMRYIRAMYARSARAFGAHELTVSTIAGVGTRDAVSRIRSLVKALDASGAPYPQAFEVHTGQRGTRVFADLMAIDRALDSLRLPQPLVIGEAAYNDRATGRAIRRFMRTSSRRVVAVLEWPLTADRPCKDISVSPPYEAGAYMAALWQS
jgi:hypothetical protein